MIPRIVRTLGVKTPAKVPKVPPWGVADVDADVDGAGLGMGFPWLMW